MPNAFVHNELTTTDVDKAKAFYLGLFDWKLEEMQMGPSGTYTMIKIGDKTAGGILKHPMPGEPSIWVPYMLVDEIKSATAKARSLGGNVIKEAVEVPNAGWFSIIQDPTGAVFGLWQSQM